MATIVGNKIRVLRNKKGYSLPQLACRAKIGGERIRQIETRPGTIRTKSSLLRKILQGLDIPLKGGMGEALKSVGVGPESFRVVKFGMVELY